MHLETMKALLATDAALLFAAEAAAVTLQTPQDIFHGRSFLYVEAEDFAYRTADPESDGPVRAVFSPAGR